MTFAEKLVRLRKREGLSQEELALFLGVSRQAVSRWEQGAAVPDASNLVKLRQRFRVSLDWLLDEARDWEEQGAEAPAEKCGLTDRQRGIIQNTGEILCWAGVIILAIIRFLASNFPCSVLEADGRKYSGFLGYVKCHDAEWLLVASLAMLLAGAVVLLWPRLRRWWEK